MPSFTELQSKNLRLRERIEKDKQAFTNFINISLQTILHAHQPSNTQGDNQPDLPERKSSKPHSTHSKRLLDKGRRKEDSVFLRAVRSVWTRSKQN